ncbi:MAG TPA: hypothetical protein VLE73_00535 [Candidatus Saccharimonadales bacterium]|nr:hypothetical protein [Candidatus Saccharimonadales bacterium]
MTTALQDATPETVALWLKQIDHSKLCDEAWLIITERFPGVSKGIASYLLEHYGDTQERQAAFDGLTLALLVALRSEDLQRVGELFDQPAVDEPAAPYKRLSAAN